MSDRLTAWVRTVVPTLWAALVAWLLSLGVPAGLLDAAGGLVEPLLVPVALAAVYAGLRWLEPRLPRWLAVVLIGSPRTPTYVGSRDSRITYMTRDGRAAGGVLPAPVMTEPGCQNPRCILAHPHAGPSLLGRSEDHPPRG